MIEDRFCREHPPKNNARGRGVELPLFLDPFSYASEMNDKAAQRIASANTSAEIQSLQHLNISTLTQQSGHIDILTLSHMTRQCLTDAYQITILDIKRALQTCTLDTTCDHEENTEQLDAIQLIVSKYPNFIPFVVNKPLIPEFEEILEQADDKDTKKMIRKANYDFIGYSCNHKHFDKQCALVKSKIVEIYESEIFKRYDQHMDYVARLVHAIQTTYDKVKNKVWVEKNDNKGVIEKLAYKAKEIVDIIILINAKIMVVNASVSLECHSCKAAAKGYDYCKRLIETMRSERRVHENKVRSIIDNPEQTFGQWMVDKYGTLERIPLADIKKAYKASFNKTITMDELSKLLTDTTIYRVTASHNKYYANKIL